MFKTFVERHELLKQNLQVSFLYKIENSNFDLAKEISLFSLSQAKEQK